MTPFPDQARILWLELCALVDGDPSEAELEAAAGAHLVRALRAADNFARGDERTRCARQAARLGEYHVARALRAGGDGTREEAA